MLIVKRTKREHAVRAVQGTQLPSELSGSNAEDLPEALPPPVQPFAVILGAGPTGAFMVSRRLSNKRAWSSALMAALCCKLQGHDTRGLVSHKRIP